MKKTSQLDDIGSGFLTLAKWIPLALLVGLSLGVVGTAFHTSIEIATEFRAEHPWIIWLLPVGGASIALLYQGLKLTKDPGTNVVLRSIYSDESIPLRMAPLIFIGAVITHLTGGSSGREGAALQLGGSIASWFGRKLKLSRRDLTIITMCGMSAAFSALFGTPLTAAIFPVEVISVGVMYHCALVPCLLASLTGFGVAQLFHVAPTTFDVSGIPELSLLSTVQVMALGILCALVSVLFCAAVHTAGKLYQKYVPNLVFRGVVGGTIVLVLTLLIGNQDYNGAGMHIIIRAMGGTVVPVAFLLKLLLTAITLGAGFKGGEIVPVFFVGATFGCAVAPLLGLAPSFGAAAGLVAVFCGVVNCPIASFILALELFGSQGLVLFAMCVSISYMISGYFGLYHDQRILYSKYQPEFINQMAK